MTEEEQFGPYELIRPAGSGGMALVHIARKVGQRDPNQRCVIKRLSADDASNPDSLGMFIEESRLSALLDHPNIVRTFDVGVVNGIPYMAMELVDGINLVQMARALLTRGERIPLRAVLDVAIAVAEALECAHTLKDSAGRPLNLIHRDVSPQNVLISRDGAVKLTDFGIARHDAREHETMGAQVKGKIGYMAPEQWAGDTLDGRVDLFALGLVVLELLSGEKVLRSFADICDVSVRVEATLAQCPGVKNKLRALLRSLVAQHPDARPRTAKEVAAAFRACLAEAPRGETVLDVVRRVLEQEKTTIRSVEPRRPSSASSPSISSAFFSTPQSNAASREGVRLLESFTQEVSMEDEYGDEDETVPLRVPPSLKAPEPAPRGPKEVEPRVALPRRPSSSIGELASRAFAWIRGEK